MYSKMSKCWVEISWGIVIEPAGSLLDYLDPVTSHTLGSLNPNPSLYSFAVHDGVGLFTFSKICLIRRDDKEHMPSWKQLATES
jgi:hypothetical protein